MQLYTEHGMTHKAQPSYYEILHISPKASDSEVKEAYRGLAKKFHPDLNPQNRRIAELRFRTINEAYAKLKTRQQRIAYNQSLRLKAENDNRHEEGFFSQISQVFWPKMKMQRTK